MASGESLCLLSLAGVFQACNSQSLESLGSLEKELVKNPAIVQLGV